MKYAKLARLAKTYVDRRGGPEAAKRDVEQLKQIARQPGTASQKARRAADLLRRPPAHSGRR